MINLEKGCISTTFYAKKRSRPGWAAPLCGVGGTGSELIYDIVEKYVIILETSRGNDSYSLLTAYYLEGKDAKRDKFSSKYRKWLLPKVY